MRGACISAEIGDPDGNRSRIRAEADDDRDALREAIAAWHATFGSAPATAAEACAKASAPFRGPDRAAAPGLADALSGLLRGDRSQLNSRTLGNALKTVKGRISGGLYFDEASPLKGIGRWLVRREAPPGAHSTESSPEPPEPPEPPGPPEPEHRSTPDPRPIHHHSSDGEGGSDGLDGSDGHIPYAKNSKNSKSSPASERPFSSPDPPPDRTPHPGPPTEGGQGVPADQRNSKRFFRGAGAARKYDP